MLAPVSFGIPNAAVDVPRAVELMRAKNWKEASIKLRNVVDQFGDRGERLFSPKYGQIYYLKGYSELQIAKESKDEEVKNKYFQMASDSMKECFEIHMRANKVHAKSLLYRAQAEQGLGNMATAIELNKLFSSASLTSDE